MKDGLSVILKQSYVAELSSLKNELDSIGPSLWTNTYIIKTILEEYEVGSVPTAKEVLKDTLGSFYKDKIMQNNSSKFVKKRAAVLLNTAKLVVDSNSITIMLYDKLDKVPEALSLLGLITFIGKPASYNW